MLRDDSRIHLNLVESSRQLFELDPGAGVERGEGWLFGAGRSSHPAISNAAIRADDGLDPEEFVERAQRFFGERRRGFSIWVRSDTPQDRALTAAAKAAGLGFVFEMPEMVIERRAEEAEAPPDVELRRLTEPEQARDYWDVAAAAYPSVGFPPEVFSYYEDDRGLLADNIAAFVAYVGGRPAAIAMTIVTDAVAGIYWVGTIEEARNRGLGRLLTATATSAGFDMGADVASLQASVMGRPVYEAMGFERVYDYRLLMAQPPEARGVSS